MQIGIDFTCEWRYLADSNWQDNIKFQHISHRPPSQIVDDANWTYVGVDVNNACIDNMIEQYPDDIWVCRSLHTGRDLKELFDSLDIKNVDILALDIEGAEDILLQTYDFIIKPEFITVEFHTENIDTCMQIDMRFREFFEPLFRKYGYNLYRVISEKKYADDMVGTTELQFLRGMPISTGSIFGWYSKRHDGPFSVST